MLPSLLMCCQSFDVLPIFCCAAKSFVVPAPDWRRAVTLSRCQTGALFKQPLFGCKVVGAGAVSIAVACVLVLQCAGSLSVAGVLPIVFGIDGADRWC